MPKKIILLRHGRTYFNANRMVQGITDALLDETGLSEAQSVSKSFADEQIDVIYSSDLKRAYHTALIVSDKINLPVVQTSLLRERGYGEFEGLSWEEIKEMLWSFKSAWNFKERRWHSSFNLEKRNKFRARVTKFLEMIKKHRGKTVLVVTHGGTIKVILSLLGQRDSFIRKMTIKNTGVIRLVVSDTGYTIKR